MIAAFSITPLGVGDSVSTSVAEAPDQAAVPWAYLGLVVGCGVTAVAVASVVAIRLARAAPVSVLRRS